MDSSGRKPEFMKPIILKAGIPLAVSLGGILYSLLAARRNWNIDRDSSEDSHVGRIENEPQEEFEDDDISQGAISTSQFEEEEEMSGLMNQVRTLQDREQELKVRFLYYCGLKEHEQAVMRLKHKLVLERARVEFLNMRIDSMKAENQRFELMVVEYMKILKQLDSARVKNSLLRKKAKKLLIERRKYASIANRQASAVHAKEEEILTNREELHRKELTIVELNGEIITLKKLVDQLHEEKKNLADEMKSRENSVSGAFERSSEEIMLTELEQLRKERVAEAEELIYLRWINACFRHELARNQEQHGNEYEEKQEQMDHALKFDSDASSTTVDHGESCAFEMTGCHSKRKFLGKLRRWAKGGEVGRKSWSGKELEHKHKHGGAPIIPYGEHHVKARKSCSSV